MAGSAHAAQKIKIACIDCYSSASLYPLVAEKYKTQFEIEWFLVQTHAYSDAQSSYLSAFPAASPRLRYDPRAVGWLDQVESDFRALGIDRVLEGMDEGSYQATAIGERLGLPHNSLRMREERKKKDRQMEVAGKDFGIPTEPLTTVDKAMRFIQTFPQDEIVVKFNDGVSGVGMEFFSKRDRHLRAKLKAKLEGSKMGPFGREDTFVIQPRIRGRKFFIDTYTFEGKTVVTGLSEYFMVDWNGTTLYFFDPFLSLTSEEARRLEPAAREINRRMEVTHGAAHIEFIIEEGTGKIYLLENNVRIAGAGVPALEREVYGMSQMELHLLSILDPDALRREMDQYPRPQKTGGLIVVIPSAHDGFLLPSGVQSLESLKTYFRPSAQYSLKPNAPVMRTQDQNSAAALAHFVGSRADIRHDVGRIVEMIQTRELIGSKRSRPCPKRIAQLAGALEGAMAQTDWLSLPE